MAPVELNGDIEGTCRTSWRWWNKSLVSGRGENILLGNGVIPWVKPGHTEGLPRMIALVQLAAVVYGGFGLLAAAWNVLEVRRKRVDVVPQQIQHTKLFKKLQRKAKWSAHAISLRLAAGQ